MNNNVKKLFSTILSGAMLLALTPAVMAATPNTITTEAYLGSEQCEKYFVGEVLEYQVKMSDFQAFASFDTYINYDPTVLDILDADGNVISASRSGASSESEKSWYNGVSNIPSIMTGTNPMIGNFQLTAGDIVPLIDVIDGAIYYNYSSGQAMLVPAQLNGVAYQTFKFKVKAAGNPDIKLVKEVVDITYRPYKTKFSALGGASITLNYGNEASTMAYEKPDVAGNVTLADDITTVTWSEPDTTARGYSVQMYFNGNPVGTAVEVDAGVTSYTVSGVDTSVPGKYEASVTALGPDDSVSTDDAVAVMSSAVYVKLDAPVINEWDNGVATWNTVDGAIGYKVYLYEGGTVVDPAGEDAPDASYTIDSALLANPVAYTIRVVALSSDTNMNSEESEPSDRATLKLATPQNIVMNGSVATWDAVDNADSYKVYLYENDSATPLYPAGEAMMTRSYTVNSALLETGKSYKVRVEAHNTANQNYTKSDLSDLTDAASVSLDAPTNINWSSNTATWTPVANADQYVVYLYKDGTTEPVDPAGEVVTSESYTIGKDVLAVPGEYTIKVKAQNTANDNFADSVLSDSSAKATAELDKPSQPAWNGTTATWTGDPYADQYIVYLYNGETLVDPAGYTVSNASYTLPTNLIGEGNSYTIEVKAVHSTNSNFTESAISDRSTAITGSAKITVHAKIDASLSETPTRNHKITATLYNASIPDAEILNLAAYENVKVGETIIKESAVQDVDIVLDSGIYGGTYTLILEGDGFLRRKMILSGIASSASYDVYESDNSRAILWLGKVTEHTSDEITIGSNDLTTLLLGISNNPAIDAMSDVEKKCNFNIDSGLNLKDYAILSKNYGKYPNEYPATVNVIPVSD